jgi:uncharacterized protein YxeA
MKKLLLPFICFLLLAAGFQSCETDSPKASATKFLNGMYHLDFESAKSVSTDKTKTMLDMMARFTSRAPDSARDITKQIKVDIKDIKEEGDKATVTYVLSDEPGDKKLLMVRKNGKWLAEWSKQDGIGSDPGRHPEDEIAPSVVDTSGQSAPAADTSANK